MQTFPTALRGVKLGLRGHDSIVLGRETRSQLRQLTPQLGHFHEVVLHGWIVQRSGHRRLQSVVIRLRRTCFGGAEVLSHGDYWH